MNRLTRALIGLYPAAWRDRYAIEFEALLEDIRPGWTVLADVVKGALVMQLENTVNRKDGFRMRRRGRVDRGGGGGSSSGPVLVDRHHAAWNSRRIFLERSRRRGPCDPRDATNSQP